MKLIMEQKKKKLYPMKFRPVAERAEWGGNWFIGKMGKTYTEQVEAGLSGAGKKKYVEMPLTKTDKIGESWELADLGFRDSEVVGGWLEGSTISEILETYLEDIVGENSYARFGRQFPLMVKLLDVEGRTPLMVCPDDEIAAQRYDTLGKVKLWHVLDAEPGSKLYMGLREEISATELYERCHNGTLEEVLNVVTPHKGDSYLIPSGLMHAAAGGVVIAEIAESSDLDFKIYNWGDAVMTNAASFTYDPSGAGRDASKKSTRRNLMDDVMSDTEELSLEAAFDFVSLGGYDTALTIPAGGHSDKVHDLHVKSAAAPDASADKVMDKLVSIREFTVTKIALKDALHIDTGTSDAFLIYVCTSGSAAVQIQKQDSGIDKYDVNAGELLLIPAELTDFFIVPQDRDTVLLEATIEPYEEEDGYIDPSVEAKLPEDDADDRFVNDGGTKASVEDLLRANMKKAKDWPLN